MTVVTIHHLLALRPQWRQAGLRLVLTNGVFDLLHRGHIEYLTQARAMGDVLVVGINSDASTRALKGPSRPLMPAADRAYLLAALRMVDYVAVFAELTAETLVQSLQPELYVKGGDYAVTDAAVPIIDHARLPEARVVQAYGGQVVLLPYCAGYSTSDLLARIVAHCGLHPPTP